ncbi:hypothetical protein GCM10023085_27280 [Actinomadura viridis]|uniref:DUF7691 domain-containing protein n=1 Tax=Actinomadura viridis TaxID=58110 RepID=A0A931DGT8_9ACTN|nr:hypothetical protein [Actinomadura viridis]MBG6087286.1 hypothetical protein [Actinomadura viridis]
MSYSLSLYLVDLDKVRGAIGSQDDKLRRMIGGRFKAQIAHSDDWFSSEIESGAPTRYDAVRAVINGGPYDEQYGFQYGYAYQMICEFYGRHLFNNHFSPFRGDWLETVDEGLRTLGIKVAVTDFMYGSVPSSLPRPEHLPCYGEWAPEECAQALAQWEATTPEQRAALDPEVLEAIESCIEWTREAQARPGTGVAGFGF